MLTPISGRAIGFRRIEHGVAAVGKKPPVKAIVVLQVSALSMELRGCEGAGPPGGNSVSQSSQCTSPRLSSPRFPLPYVEICQSNIRFENMLVARYNDRKTEC